MRVLTFFFFIWCGMSAIAGEGRVELRGTIFLTYTASPKQMDLYWREPSGKLFRQFSALHTYLGSRKKRLRFIMNGGIFEEGGIPSGLLVINGTILHPINTAEGHGNFYLKPNGIFYIDARGAHVASTEEYISRAPSPRIAIQSGPLLLSKGEAHPAFRRDSKNFLHRNGVGILKDGSVLFAITEFGQNRYPNLYEFADFFRAQGCRDALFLDGDLSEMVVDPKAPIRPGNFIGTMFAITEDEK